MDTLTHIVVGACIGEVALGKQLGKKAMLYGAVAQSIPDIDFIASFWLPTAENLLAHRGLTHSFFFALVVAPAIGYIMKLTYRRSDISLRKWIIFFLIQVFSHDFIDAFNAYGTGWFEPFSSERISFHVLFVADPLYSIWPAIAFVMMLVLKRKNQIRRRWAISGLVVPVIYLIYALGNKYNIDRAARQAFVASQIPREKYFTTPTPFNNWLWYVVAKTDSGFYIGYRSVFDRKPGMQFAYFPQSDSLLGSVKARHEVDLLKKFSQGYYTIERWKDTLVFNDLRFEQIIGWNDPRAKFAFHYFLDPPLDNAMVVQRGRIAKWDSAAINSLVRKIRGN